MLLGSPPNMIHGSKLRKTRLSTAYDTRGDTVTTLKKALAPAIADCR